MPEGHTIHKIAKDHSKLLVGRPVAVSSPQGRFAADAERLGTATASVHADMAAVLPTEPAPDPEATTDP